VKRESVITGNTFKQICDDFLDEEKMYIDILRKPKIIFLKTDWIKQFKSKILPLIDYTFTLVTHNSDCPAPGDNLDLLEDKRLIKWFGMNCNIKHPKLQSIPIGIANEKWPHGNKDILLQVVNENIEKKNLVYCNFDVTTNFAKRNNTLNVLSSHSYIDFDKNKLPFDEYLRKLSTYKYVISPPGNSVDCHRIWESIYLGVVPIVEKHLALEYWYDLPILFVDSFNDINAELLETKYQQIIDNSRKKTIMSHYTNMINSNIKYFCLHHPPLTDRKEHLQERFNTLNLDVEWVTGFMPDEITIPDDASFKNKAEYSLYLKQLYCIEQQVKNNLEYIIVFEDDVLLEDNFNEHVNQCLREFNELNGDLLFLGVCCGIHPSNVIPERKVYWEPNFQTRCAHCYMVTLDAAKKIYKHLLVNPVAYDYKLNDIIHIESLKSCYGEPGIHQGTQGGKYPSSLLNHNG